MIEIFGTISWSLSIESPGARGVTDQDVLRHSGSMILTPEPERIFAMRGEIFRMYFVLDPIVLLAVCTANEWDLSTQDSVELWMEHRVEFHCF